MAKKAPTKNASDLRSLSYADRMKWWTHDRFGMFIHWGLYSIKAKHEWIRNYEKISNEAYQVYFDEFDPVRFDPDLWAAVAKAAGQKYAVLTAKHHEGFCLFDSRHTDYKATNTPAGRDLVREYVDAFRAAGLKVGFYYSLIDWHHPDYPCDHLHPMRDDAEYKARPRDFNRYLDYMHAQVKELCTNYGQIDVMWFDFSYGEMSGEKWRARQLVDMIRKYQPNVIIDNRLTLGHVDPKARGLGDLGDFCSPECIIPSEGMRDADGKPVCWESCITLNANWGYNRDDAGYKSPRDAVRMLTAERDAWKARAIALESVISESTHLPLADGGCWCYMVRTIYDTDHEPDCERIRETWAEVPPAPGEEEVSA